MYSTNEFVMWNAKLKQKETSFFRFVQKCSKKAATTLYYIEKFHNRCMLGACDAAKHSDFTGTEANMK